MKLGIIITTLISLVSFKVFCDEAQPEAKPVESIYKHCGPRCILKSNIFYVEDISEQKE